MRLAVVSLFPELVMSIRDYGVTGRAIDKGLLQLQAFNPRDYATDKHRTVDDRPYGGGPGMVGMVAPWRAAICAARAAVADSDKTGQGGKQAKTVYLSPQGKRIDRDTLQAMSEDSAWVLVAGRYEGLDERLLQTEIDAEWSLGDFVLSGGELAAMAVIDAVTRRLPGALGHEDSAEQDSFERGLLDCPHYTRPEQFEGLSVPPVLLSGDHAAIATWREQQALGNTWLKRPELLDKLELSAQQRELLSQFQQEYRLAKAKHEKD